jgi:hypothetical protein
VVAEDVRRVSPETEAAIIGGIAGGGVGGFFTLLGVALGLFGQRWVRRIGEVRCVLVAWKDHGSTVNASRESGKDINERRLEVKFLNRKDETVTVWDMRVVFYKQGQPLDEEDRPDMQFVGESARTPLGPVDLPPRETVTRVISVYPHRNVDYPEQQAKKLEAVHEADKVEFVATMVGAKDVSKELTRWHDLTPWQQQTVLVR